MVLNPRDILSSSQNHQVISFPCSLAGTPMRERGDENQVLCYMEFSAKSTLDRKSGALSGRNRHKSLTAARETPGRVESPASSRLRSCLALS